MPLDPSPAQAAQLVRWRISTFWVMLVGYIGYYLVRGNLPVALPLLSQEFGFTNTELGLILTFSELAYAAGKFANGPLADQIGGKRIFLIGMWGAIAANLLFPLRPSLLYFTAVACLARYFLSMGWGGIIKTIGEWYEPERNGTIMGLISVNFQFGGVLASLFASALIAYGVGWAGLFYWPALVVTAMAVVSHVASRGSPREVAADVRFGRSAGARKSAADFGSGPRPSATRIVRKLFSIPLFRQVLVFSFVVHILRSFFMVWVPKFMVDLGMENVKAGLTSAVFPLMGVLGTIALGWYTDRYAEGGDRTGAMWKMLVGLVFSLAAIALLIPFGLRFQAAIVVLLGASGLFLYGPYSMSAGCMSLDIAGPEGAGTCTGMVDGIGYIGGALASWGAGVVADRFGWTQVFWALSAFAAFTVAWTYTMSRFARHGGTEVSMLKNAAVAGALLACLAGPRVWAAEPRVWAAEPRVRAAGPRVRAAGPASAFEVEGHRGARWVRPENTLAAFRYALAAGVDTLELDLHVTKDDILVVTHDPFVNPELCLGPGGKRVGAGLLIRSLTLNELRRYDCGSLVNPRFPEQVKQPKERIPTFEELLTWLDRSPDPRARRVKLNVETKSEEAHPEYAPPPEAFARLVLAAAEKHTRGDRLVLQSFDFRTLEAAKRLEPRTVVSALVEDRPDEPLVALAGRVKADIVSPNHEWLTQADVSALHQAGVKVVPWTANTEEAWRKLAGFGVDGIITDNPKPLLEFRSRLK